MNSNRKYGLFATPNVCSCYHLRRRPSFDAADLRLPKVRSRRFSRTVVAPFWSDLSRRQALFSPSSPYVGRSRLCEEVRHNNMPADDPLGQQKLPRWSQDQFYACQRGAQLVLRRRMTIDCNGKEESLLAWEINA